MRTQLPLWLGLAFLVIAVGCGGPKPPADLPELHPLTIEVVQDGKPLVEASISLYAEGSTLAIGGSTDASGKAVIRTLGEFEGAPVGTYKVCIIKEEIESGTPSDDPMVSGTPSARFNLVDSQFESIDTTTLEIEVVAGDNAPPALDVGDAVKDPITGG